MADSHDPTAHWARELAGLRSRSQRSREATAPDQVTSEAALTLCEALLRDLAGAHLECERLRGKVRTQTETWQHLFEAMPGACVATDHGGFITAANRAAALLLNTSAKHLRDRQLLVFSRDRAMFSDLLQRVGRGDEIVRGTVTLRPRERKPVVVDVIVAPLSLHDTASSVWFLSPASGSQTFSLADAVDDDALSVAD